MVLLTQYRWVQRCQQIHRDKLKHMKSTPQTLDNRAPKKHMHLILKQKKHQQEEERFAQIELENRILLDKMAKIMQVRCLRLPRPGMPARAPSPSAAQI